MSIQAKHLLWLASVAAVFMLLFGVYRYGRHAEAVIQEASRTKAIAEQQARNDALKTKLEVNHANDQKQIDTLAADIRRLRVRMPAGCSNVIPASGGADTAPASQPLPVDPQIAFDAFEAGLGELAKEADDAIANCRVVMEWAKAQGK